MERVMTIFSKWKGTIWIFRLRAATGLHSERGAPIVNIRKHVDFSCTTPPGSMERMLQLLSGGRYIYYHFIFLKTGDADGHPRDWEALQTRDTRLEFFTFAPRCIIDGKNIQDYLQEHFITAMGHLADRIRDVEGGGLSLVGTA